MRVWTEALRPFVMGGDTRYAHAADLEVEGPHELGKGFVGWLATAPNGRTSVAEDMSGGIVGDTLAEVRRDVGIAPAGLMRRQVEAAVARGATAEVVAAEEFWKRMRRSG